MNNSYHEIPNYGSGSQVIQFVQFKKNEEHGMMDLEVDGVTNEEVITVLISRLESQNSKVYSLHTEEAIRKLREALMWLDARTADRKRRGVHNTEYP